MISLGKVMVVAEIKAECGYSDTHAVHEFELNAESSTPAGTRACINKAAKAYDENKGISDYSYEFKFVYWLFPDQTSQRIPKDYYE